MAVKTKSDIQNQPVKKDNQKVIFYSRSNDALNESEKVTIKTNVLDTKLKREQYAVKKEKK